MRFSARGPLVGAAAGAEPAAPDPGALDVLQAMASSVPRSSTERSIGGRIAASGERSIQGGLSTHYRERAVASLAALDRGGRAPYIPGTQSVERLKETSPWQSQPR